MRVISDFIATGEFLFPLSLSHILLYYMLSQMSRENMAATARNFLLLSVLHVSPYGSP